jgi:uncharacterized protein YdaU (DUF1376 family)
MLQHGSYTLLIDACYDREKFPTMDEAIEWAWASTPDEVHAVQFVLSKFFTLENGVYVQNRIRQELDEFHAKSAINTRIAIDRETKRAKIRTERAQVDHEPPPNQEPRTTNHKPSKPKAARKPAPDLPDCISPEVWQRWIDYRREIKKPLSPSTVNAQISKLTEMNARGVNPEQVIDTSILNGWIGLIEPKNGSNHGNGKQTRFDKLAATAAALTGSSQRTFDSATGRMD